MAMDAKRAAEVLRYKKLVGPDEWETARDMGAQALEALHWWFDEDHEPEREAVRIKHEEAGVKWTSDQWLAAVLAAMVKEGKG